MTDQQPIGSLADELRQLAAVLTDSSDAGVEGLLSTIREQFEQRVPGPGNDPDIERIDIS